MIEVRMLRLDGRLRLLSWLLVMLLGAMSSSCATRDTAHDPDSEELDESAATLRDRRRPTAPGQFRVTQTTPFRATLAWTPASDDSGAFSYVLASTAGPSVTLPQSATGYTWTSNLAPRNSYTFILYARDAAGNASSSVSVSTTLPADTSAPSVAPVLSLESVGSSYVSLRWTPAQDDGPYVFYQLLLNGAPYADVGSALSTTLHQLQPSTNYLFSVRARDYGNNWSPASAPLSVVTSAPNPADVTPPSTPQQLQGSWWDDGEVHLNWQASTDDVDPQPLLRYDVYVNGVLSDTLFGSGGRSVVYANVGVLNTFEVVASDTTGNRSAPASLTLRLAN